MASVTVKVDISQQSLEKAVNDAPGTRSAINSMTAQIAARANSMASEVSGIWYETGKPHNPDREGGGEFHTHGKSYPKVGGVAASYASKPAKKGPSGLVGIVFSANYAAQKDNLKHNTLLKVKG